MTVCSVNFFFTKFGTNSKQTINVDFFKNSQLDCLTELKEVEIFLFSFVISEQKKTIRITQSPALIKSMEAEECVVDTSNGSMIVSTGKP